MSLSSYRTGKKKEASGPKTLAGYDGSFVVELSAGDEEFENARAMFEAGTRHLSPTPVIQQIYKVETASEHKRKFEASKAAVGNELRLFHGTSQSPSCTFGRGGAPCGGHVAGTASVCNSCTLTRLQTLILRNIQPRQHPPSLPPSQVTSSALALRKATSATAISATRAKTFFSARRRS